MKKAVAIFLFGLMLPAMAGAQDLASLEKMRQAAEHGSIDAQLEMGILYEFGYNMPKNDVYALAWYMHAADQGSALAGKRRELLKARMTPEQVDAAQKLASGLITQMPPGAPAPTATDKQPEAAAPSTEPTTQPSPAPTNESPATTATKTPPAADSQAQPVPATAPSNKQPGATAPATEPAAPSPPVSTTETPPAGGEAEKPASDSAGGQPSP